jgi:citrate synthase
VKVWWRTRELSSQEESLLKLLFEAHRLSSFRPNISSVSVVNAAIGSGSIAKAIAAAILTLGGKHAPLEQTYLFLSLEDPAAQVQALLARGEKVPGWGGSFQKDGVDPIWEPVRLALAAQCAALSQKLDEVTAALHRQGKVIYPNPSAYTAAVALALEVPPSLSVYLFISARLDAWANIAFNELAREHRETQGRVAPVSGDVGAQR